MTASYNPKPQRQVRKLEADPAKASDPAGVDRPAQLWQQLGGQLLDNRSYSGLIQDKRDNIKQIENFIGAEGGHTALSNWAERDYEEKIAKKVNALYKKTAEAEIKNKLINDEAKRLKDSNAIAEAEQLLRRNNLADHYWNLKDAELAAQEVTVGLEVWGTQNASALAGLDVQQRSAAIQKKRAQLLEPYNTVPQEYIAAYVDPKLLVADKSIKEAVLKEEYKLKDLQNKDLGFKSAINNFRSAALYQPIANSEGLEELTGFSHEYMQTAYDDGKTTFAKHNPLYSKNGDGTGGLNKAGEREYNSLWFNYAPRLFLNKDGDNYNDVATNLHFGYYWKALEKVKTSDGLSLLELKRDIDGKSTSLRTTLFYQMNQAIRMRTMLENQANQEEKNRAKEALKLVEKNYAEVFPTLNGKEEHDAYRAKVKAQFLDDNNNPVNIPPGYTYKTWMEKIDEKIPEFFRYESSEATRDNKQIIDELLTTTPYADVDDIPKDLDMKPYGFDGTYGDFFDAIQNGASHKYLLTKTSANSTKSAQQMENQVDTLSTQLVNGLEENFKNSNVYQEALANNTKFLPEINDLIDDASAAAGLLLEGQAKKFIRQELLKLEPHERLLPENQSKILADAQRLFYEQPNYKDPTLWRGVDPTNKETFGRTMPIPIGGVDTWDDTKGWINGVNNDTDLKNWSVFARPYFVKGASGSKEGKENANEYLSNNFVLSDTTLNEINAYLLSGDDTKLSPKVYEDLNHIKYALDGNLSLGEIAKAQINRLYSQGKGKPPIILESDYERLNQRGEIPVAKTGNTARDEGLFIYPEFTDSQEGIEFKIERNNGLQTSNNIVTPFSGTVISVAEYEDSGLTIMLETDDVYAGVPRGTRVVIRHCGSTEVQEGQYLAKGNSLCVGGDHSVLPNSTEGSTTGTDIEAGHAVIQFLEPGTELTENGEVGTISVTQDPNQEDLGSDIYQFDVSGEYSGLLNPDMQNLLFQLHFMPHYQEATPIYEEDTIDLSGDDTFYDYPITTE